MRNDRPKLGNEPRPRERFRRTTDFGPKEYAEQAEQADPGGDAARLRADAVSAAGLFFDKLFQDDG
jgi:hypothetical protein